MNTPTNRDMDCLNVPGPTAAPSVLLALADRCERENPSLMLRCDIGKALGWREVNHDCHIRYIDPDGRMWWATEMPDWPGSLDAAVTLVPEHCEWSELGRHVEWGEPSPLTGSCEREYCVTISLMDATGNFLGNSVHGATETLPMSICAAALRARAALVQS